MKNVVSALAVISIPLMLFFATLQASRYASLEREIYRTERSQENVIKANKNLISSISLLSTPERIERVALSELSMRKAKKDEILRIALKKGGLGG